MPSHFAAPSQRNGQARVNHTTGQTSSSIDSALEHSHTTGSHAAGSSAPGVSSITLTALLNTALKTWVTIQKAHSKLALRGAYQRRKSGAVKCMVQVRLAFRPVRSSLRPRQRAPCPPALALSRDRPKTARLGYPTAGATDDHRN